MKRAPSDKKRKTDSRMETDGTLQVPLYDMHCHLAFAVDPDKVAHEVPKENLFAFSATVTPDEYERAQADFADFANLRIGLGLHPWWIADGRCTEHDVARFENLAPSVPFIAEIGLDFAGARGAGETRAKQVAAFERLLAACCIRGTTACTKLISLHAVHAANEVLDALERYSITADHRCIFHWFSGSADELDRAIRTGCFFSINARMLASRRGRACICAIPENRLLLETDAPMQDNTPWTASAWRRQLEETLRTLAHLRACDEDSLALNTAAHSARLLDFTQETSAEALP